MLTFGVECPKVVSAAIEIGNHSKILGAKAMLSLFGHQLYRTKENIELARTVIRESGSDIIRIKLGICL
jgi:hypothetical protein